MGLEVDEMNVVLFVIGLTLGWLVGTFIESKSAKYSLEKAKTEITSKEYIINSLNKQVLYLKERRY
jgi:uncharacterized membrane protein YciS (DUF1049 family)